MEFLEGLAKGTGQVPDALSRRPKNLGLLELEYLKIFSVLNAGRRRSGEIQIPQPLSLTEIAAFFDVFDDYSADEKWEIILLIQKMDIVFLNYWASKAGNK